VKKRGAAAGVRAADERDRCARARVGASKPTLVRGVRACGAPRRPWLGRSVAGCNAPARGGATDRELRGSARHEIAGAAVTEARGELQRRQLAREHLERHAQLETREVGAQAGVRTSSER